MQIINPGSNSKTNKKYEYLYSFFSAVLDGTLVASGIPNSATLNIVDQDGNTLSENLLPFSVVSSSASGGYQGLVRQYYDDVDIVNIHRDNIPAALQSPFVAAHVGGHRFRSVSLNPGSDDAASRPEAYRLTLQTSGRLAISGTGYTNPRGLQSKEEHARRAQNTKNIQYNTGSAVLGNYRKNYEIVQTTDIKKRENTYVSSAIDYTQLPATTHPFGLFGLQASAFGNIFGGQQPGKSSRYDIAAVAAAAGGEPWAFVNLHSGTAILTRQNDPTTTPQALEMTQFGYDLELGDTVFVHMYWSLGSALNESLYIYNETGSTLYRGQLQAFDPSVNWEYAKQYTAGIFPVVLSGNVDESLWYHESAGSTVSAVYMNPIFKLTGLDIIELGNLDYFVSGGASQSPVDITTSQDISASPSGLQAGDLVFALALAECDSTTTEQSVAFTVGGDSYGGIRDLSRDTSAPNELKHNETLLLPFLLGADPDATLKYSWDGAGGRFSLRPIFAMRDNFTFIDLEYADLGIKLKATSFTAIDLSSLAGYGLEPGDLLFVFTEMESLSFSSDANVIFYNDSEGLQWRGGAYTMSRVAANRAGKYNKVIIVEVLDDLSASFFYNWPNGTPTGDGLSVNALFAIRPA